jgi:hypothetical protein
MVVKMEAKGYAKPLVTIYNMTWCYNTETHDLNLANRFPVAIEKSLFDDCLGEWLENK